MGKKHKADKERKTATQEELERKLEKERLEQLEISNSILSNSPQSAESLASSHESVVEEEVNIFDIIHQSDNESLLEDEEKYMEQKLLPSALDFFADFRELPDIDDISYISVASILPEVSIEKQSGKFVDPLSDLLESTESTSSTSEDQKDEDSEPESDSSLAIPETPVESIFSLPEEEIEVEQEQLAPVVDTIEAFVEFQLHAGMKPQEEDEIDFEALARAEEAKLVYQNTIEFLTKLINKVVTNAEHLTPQKFLQQNLDKRKLLLELADTAQSYRHERYKCDFLNRQAVQHFRRKKSFRAIMEDNSSTLIREQQKLIEAKERLDRNLAAEIKLRSGTEKLREELKHEYIKLKMQAAAEIQSFENTVRKHLQQDSWPKLSASVDRLLLIMKSKRQEISEVRFSLFLRQHTAAKLEDLISKTEDLGNGFTMKGFTTFQAENQTLDKKIEERNDDLTKLHLNYYENIHTMAHCSQKQKMLNDTIKMQRALLAHLRNEKRTLREHLYSLKLRRSRIHDKIKKLNIESGILSKPHLMFDYDDTARLFVEKKENVEDLKRTLSLTQNKIDAIVERCSM